MWLGFVTRRASLRADAAPREAYVRASASSLDPTESAAAEGDGMRIFRNAVRYFGKVRA